MPLLGVEDSPAMVSSPGVTHGGPSEGAIDSDELEADDFNPPAPLIVHPALLLEDMFIYLLMPFTLLWLSEKGAARFVRTSLFLQEEVGRESLGRTISRRWFFYLGHSCLPALVWIMVYLNYFTQPSEDERWPPVVVEVMMPVLFLLGTASVYCAVEQLRDRSHATSGSKNPLTIGSGRNVRRRPRLESDPTASVNWHGLELRQKHTVGCVTYTLPTSLKWKGQAACEQKLKRLRMMHGHTLKDVPWDGKTRRSSRLMPEEYIEVLEHRRGITPADVGNLFMSSAGVRIPPEDLLDGLVQRFSWTISKVVLAVNYLVIFVLLLLPNFFREEHTLMQLPGCWRGWFCYLVYVLCLAHPASGFRFLMSVMKMQRKYLWRHKLSVEALTSMLQGKKALKYCLPTVRVTEPKDLLAWLELNELVQEKYTSNAIRPVGDWAVSYLFLMTLGLAGWLLYFAFQEKPDGLYDHKVLMVMLFFFVPVTGLELIRVVLAGVRVNEALKSRLKQLNRDAHNRRMLAAHAGYERIALPAENSLAGEGSEQRQNAWAHSAQLAKDCYDHLLDMRVKVRVLGAFSLDRKKLLSLVIFLGSSIGKAMSTGIVHEAMSHIYDCIVALWVSWIECKLVATVGEHGVGGFRCP